MSDQTLYRINRTVGEGAIALMEEAVRQGVLVPVEPITVICKHNTPGALTTSLFLDPGPDVRIPEGTYALVPWQEAVDE